MLIRKGSTMTNLKTRQKRTAVKLDTSQEEVRRTCVEVESSADQIKLALIGIQDELDEISGPLKKDLWHGHPADLVHLEEEIGYLLWYVALLCEALGLRLADALRTNLEKLQKRYPDGFCSDRSQQRHEAAGMVPAGSFQAERMER